MKDTDYVIVFHDGKTKTITKEQGEKIFELSTQTNQRGVVIGNEFVAFSAISRLLPMLEFEQESQARYNAPDIPSLPEPSRTPEQARAYHMRGMKSLARGLENYIKSPEYRGSESLKKILTKIKCQSSNSTSSHN